MVDEQTKRSIETMVKCGLDIEGLKGCFSKVDIDDLKKIYDEIKNSGEEEHVEINLSCNCS